MLTHLRVQNIALIDDITLDPDEGLNIFTGETGSGKSIILGALQLALGARVSKELLGDATRPAQVDLLFCVPEPRIRKALEDLSVEMEDDELLLSRTIAPNGRAVNHVNGKIVPASVLQSIGSLLVDLHGQHEHQSLLDASRHIDLLDRFDERTTGLKKQLHEKLLAYKEKEREFQSLRQTSADKERLIELLRFEAAELDAAGIVEGEEEELLEKIRFAQNAVRIRQSTQQAAEALDGENHRNAAASIHEAIAALGMIESLDRPALGPMILSLREAAAIAGEIASDIRRYAGSVETEPQELARMEERLSLIRRLKGKYGQTYEQICAYRSRIADSIAKIESVEEQLKTIRYERKELYVQIEALCDRLSACRRETGDAVAKAITGILMSLQFQDPQFSVSITQKDTIGAKGRDAVQFLIRTNIGEALRPLDRIASGGEISRIMLAIKTVLADRDEIPTLIFDEIDTGISGRTAQSVAEKLAMISRYHQVIAVTHLPQIAAMADHHMVIEKIADDRRARTVVRSLGDAESEEELARMLGGVTMTESARQNAAELKKLAGTWKVEMRKQ